MTPGDAERDRDREVIQWNDAQDAPEIEGAKIDLPVRCELTEQEGMPFAITTCE